MKVGRRTPSDNGRARLLEAWVGKPELGDAIGCVATSFTFDPTFFEEQLLTRFFQVESDPAEDAHGYVIEREEKLSSGFAFALVDQSHVRAERSLRWNLLPMRVPGGIFHPKVAILAWSKCIRVIVSSANLTEPGYRKNFEQMALLEFLPTGDIPLSVLTEVIGFVDAVRPYAPGADATDGPQAALNRLLRKIESQFAGWEQGAWTRGEPRCHFVGIRPEQPHLFQRLGALWSGPPADEAWVLSPFYSDGGDLKKTLAGLNDVLLKRGERSTFFLSSGRTTPDGRVEVDLPRALASPSTESHAHMFAFVPERDEESEKKDIRALHAKSVWLLRGDRALVTVGSSNFTAAGTGVGTHVNVEANVVYDLPDLKTSFGKSIDRAFPPYERIDAESAIFRHDGTDRTPDPEAYAPLPAPFGAATFRVSGGGYSIEFELLGTPPGGFTVLTVGRHTFTDEAAWAALGRPERFELQWTEPRPPTAFLVQWHEGATSQEALWIVNVGSAADLPPPDELRSLRLEELLEILTSARPYHEIVGQILQRREKAAALAALGVAAEIEVDPHKKVDTRNFLLKRMKRIAQALEGLKERLERPVFSIEALMWRLHGPFGPVTLARHLAKEEGAGAAFMIAEVALTVNDATIPAEGTLATIDIPRERAKVLDGLRGLALEHPAPANLASYVEETFAELLR